ncbi:poly-gamma-glutamate synthase PgsB [Oceanobacillus jeddahense]|uniref:Poly-gamma-glutamate synthase PgsB n=1 Tax=Oceanobacillus jeddahense TaxID=1462527 RepID=A0ABY5JWG8_9BACI|nr:poly-gamma-glutamate synthase PgsB [Oceanobacillus jeddahense]UUI04484.1 poly-gamma-glutamate synthase PgsB [Oceanobacillus jeddahense]
MLLIPIVLVIALVIGIMEWNSHKKHVKALPIRVNVNGIRGKSTVTRLITGIIKEAGYKTIGKTTGTSARMIYWNTSEEEPIIRRPEGPNIREQKIVVKKAAEMGAEALVSECMAVNPDYQIIFQEKLLQANIGVIVNVLEDHMDVMGPTLDEVAEAFTATIPHNGHLIVSEGPYVDYFKQEAAKRNTKVIVADNRKIPETYLRKFDYMIFPENASLALAVAEALDIDEKTAFRGMLKAQPDPGAMWIRELKHGNTSAYFVNGFAANDSVSTINIWKNVETLGYPAKSPIIVMNCREDRVDRTIQFADDVLPHIPIGVLVLIGEKADPIKNAIKSGRLKVNQLIDLQGKPTDEIYETLIETASDNMIYGIGNIHGAAEPLVEKIQAHAEIGGS